MAKYKILTTIIFLAGLGFCLSQIFSGAIILPQYFHLGPLTIHYYGIIMALAVLAAFYLAIKRSSAYGITSKQAEDILFWTIIGGFIGARLYHVLSSFGYYTRYPIDIFKVYNGGLSIYGAVLGGILTLVIWQRLNGKRLMSRVTLDIMDWLVPSVVLGQIIGRFGNLFNYEAFGYPTNLFWKMFVPLNFRPVQFQNVNFFHPWFLYEVLGNLIILFLLLKVIPSKYKKVPQGFIAFLYILLYNSLRFCLEFLRVDSTFFWGFRLNAIVSLILVILGVLGLIFVDKNYDIKKS